ncbi:hypothetical protein [Actinoplanes philippinensis]|uniref:hypothetical protein n=1 Tax=Actinoplanes philippinensis TaxID=35752 RepID=UPI003411D503
MLLRSAGVVAPGGMDGAGRCQAIGALTVAAPSAARLRPAVIIDAATAALAIRRAAPVQKAAE